MPRRYPTTLSRPLGEIRAGLIGMLRDRRPFDAFIVILAVGLAAGGAPLGAVLVLVWGAWVRRRVDPRQPRRDGSGAGPPAPPPSPS